MLKLEKMKDSEWKFITNDQEFLDWDYLTEFVVNSIICMSMHDNVKYYLTRSTVNFESNGVCIQFYGDDSIERLESIAQDLSDEDDIDEDTALDVRVWSLSSITLYDYLMGYDRKINEDILTLVNTTHKRFLKEVGIGNKASLYDVIYEFKNFDTACNTIMTFNDNGISAKFGKYKNKFYVMLTCQKSEMVKSARFCVESGGRIVKDKLTPFFKEHVFK